MTMSSFERLATVSASTKRASISGGKRGAPSEYLTGLSITPLDPADPATRAEIQHRLGLETPLELLQTFINGAVDVKEGDVLVVGSNEYPIKAVGGWAAGASAPAYRRLIVEELKR
jgi:hypothetical protein